MDPTETETVTVETLETWTHTLPGTGPAGRA
jgi:hypothetical protein